MSKLCFRVLLLGFRSFLFERRKGKCFVELARLIVVFCARLVVVFRVGLEQFFVGVGLSRFPVGLSQFFVRAVVVTGGNFVGLARFNFFCFALGLRSFVSELRFRGPLLGFRSFFFGRCGGEGKSFVELAVDWFCFALDLRIAQLFVGVALSGFPVVLSRFFCLGAALSPRGF
jgi:hypothetical protein